MWKKEEEEDWGRVPELVVMQEDSEGEEEEKKGPWEREEGQGLACPSPPGSPKPEGPWDWRPVARRRRASATPRKASSSEEDEDEDDDDEEENILTKLYRIKLD